MIVYICDGDADGCRKTCCAYLHSDGECMRTTQEHHAKYGKVADPLHNERFEQVNDNWLELYPPLCGK